MGRHTAASVKPIINHLLPAKQGFRLFQVCVAGVFILILAIFLFNYPAGLTPLKFAATITGLIFLSILNLIGINLAPSVKTTKQILLDWFFLIVSASLIFAVIIFSGQVDLAYLLSLVCIQADANQEVWPGGILFSVVILAAWLAFQLFYQIPLSIIIGREMALIVGVAFGLVVVTLLKRSVRQTQKTEAVLAELQEANQKLEDSLQKDKELVVAEERLRLARELHDSITQSLYSLSLYAEAASEQINSGHSDIASEHLKDLRETAQAALREMRLFIYELRKPSLENEGLSSALEKRLQAVEVRSKMEVEFQVEGDEKLLSEVSQKELYSIAVEALNNILKHAQANKTKVHLVFSQEFTLLEIQDDGIGFDLEATRSRGFGITGMKERANKIDAQLQIVSSPGDGTLIRVKFPK